MHSLSSLPAAVARRATFYGSAPTAIRRLLGLLLVCALFVAFVGPTVQAQEPYPAPAINADPTPTVMIESYPGADPLIPVQGGESVAPTAYPEPGQPTTGPAIPSVDQGGAGQPTVATPVPMPSVPVDSGSRVSLLLAGLVLVGLVVVVGLILARRRQ